ncbi:hypothetical protein METH_06790 [Leisingera methylohalidivorans DSM 14336]|uniref:Transposase n=2 Tax=Leisingera methylohalidivorans TaxID=133924 RepID=V9VYV9_9RHOB|nr:hypothetical protein METH_06790 [Leisingera methylohalidivorans DSM 14336]
MKAKLATLRSQVETQAETIKALWVERAQLRKKIERLQAALEAEQNRKPTPEEVAEAIFVGGNFGQGQ